MVLFDERGNSFISFFQQFARWTVPIEGEPKGPIANQAGLRAFVSSDRKQLRVNNARSTARACVCGRGHSGTCLIAPTDDDNLQSREDLIATSAGWPCHHRDVCRYEAFFATSHGLWNTIQSLGILLYGHLLFTRYLFMHLIMHVTSSLIMKKIIVRKILSVIM